MTIWYSRRIIQPGAGKVHGAYYVASADQIHELDQLWRYLLKKEKHLYNREICDPGLAAISRRTGRPVIKFHSSLAGDLEKNLKLVEVPDGYLQMVITLLRREYVRLDAKIDFDSHKQVQKYFRDKLSALKRELVLGKLTYGKREPPDAIPNPEELDDTVPSDDRDYIDRVRHRVSQIKILNARIDALDLKQRSPVRISEEPTGKVLVSYVRTPKETQIINTEDDNLPAHMRFAIERGLIHENLDD